MRRTLPLAMLISLVAASPTALALGLGDPRVASNLNEPLNARIALTDLRGLDPSRLKVRLADEAAFEQAGLSLSALAEGVRLSLASGAGGMELVLTSQRPVREPYLDLLVTLLWPGGQQRRQVTLLFDPSGYASAPALIEGVNANGTSSAVEVATATAPGARKRAVSSRELPVSRTSPSTSRVRVQAGDTLWKLAERVRPDTGVSLDQVMLALFQANPDAFPNGNINGLRAGAVLDVPASQAMAASSASEAGHRVQAQNRAWQSDDEPVVAESGKRTDESEVADATPSQEAPAASSRLTLLSDADLAAEREASERHETPSTDAARAPGTPAVADGGDERRLDQLTAQWQANRDALAQVREERDRMQAEIATLRQDVSELRELLHAPVADSEVADTQPRPTADAGDSATATVSRSAAAAAEPVAEQGANAGARRHGLWQSVQDNILTIAGVALALLLALWAWVRRRDADQRDRQSVNFPLGAATRVSLPDTQAGAAASSASTRREPPAMNMAAPGPSSAGPARGNGPQAGGSEPSAPQAETISEADILIAYGRYDQARDVLQQRLEAEPERHDLRLKLLAVVIELGDHEAARREAARLDGCDDAECRQEARRLMLAVDTPARAQESDGDALQGASSEFPDETFFDTIQARMEASAAAGRDDDIEQGSPEPAQEWQAAVPEERMTEASSSDSDPEHDETSPSPAVGFIDYEPPQLDAAPTPRRDELQQPSVEYPGSLALEEDGDAFGTLDDERQAAPRPETVFEQDWDIEEVAFEPLNLDNEQPATGASHASPEQLLERARQRLDEGETGSARELLHALTEQDDAHVVEEARVLIERHNLY